MCDPVVGLTVASGIASTVGGAQSANAQADAQYAANKNQRQAQINQQRSKLTLDTTGYYNRSADREAADFEAGRAANEAYLGNQNKYNDKVKAFMSSKQNRMIKALETAGTIGAKGGRGGSRAAMQVANKAALGRDTAMGMANLRSAATNMMVDNRAVQGQLQGDYMNNFSRVGAIPTAGFTPPEVVKGPGANPLSIIGGIGSAVAGGLSAAQAAGSLPNGQTQTDLGGGSWDPYGGAGSFDLGIDPITFPNYSGINYGG